MLMQTEANDSSDVRLYENDNHENAWAKVVLAAYKSMQGSWGIQLDAVINEPNIISDSSSTCTHQPYPCYFADRWWVINFNERTFSRLR